MTDDDGIESESLNRLLGFGNRFGEPGDRNAHVSGYSRFSREKMMDGPPRVVTRSPQLQTFRGVCSPFKVPAQCCDERAKPLGFVLHMFTISMELNKQRGRLFQLQSGIGVTRPNTKIVQQLYASEIDSFFESLNHDACCPGYAFECTSSGGNHLWNWINPESEFSNDSQGAFRPYKQVSKVVAAR